MRWLAESVVVVRCRFHFACAALLLAFATPRIVGADEPDGTTTHWVDFEAGHVEVDGDLQRIELTGDVAVTSGRFRLSGDDLTLTQGPRGAEVNGKGQLAMCPCDEAPVSVGFRSATIAPPTDLILERATLRIGDVPVAWLPLLWMRSPRRIGLLPPHVSWRAEDGLFAGSGLHVPLEPEDRTGRDFLDARAGAYAKGGVEGRVDMIRRQHVLHARWDHLDASLADLEGHGVARRTDAGYFAWRTDLLRGPRADQGTPELRRAVRRHDRLRVGVGQATPVWTGGVSLRSDLLRGGGFDDLGAGGPQASIGLGGPISRIGAVASDLRVRSVANPRLGDASLAGERVALRLANRPSPIGITLDAGQDLLAVVTELDEGVTTEARGRLGAGFPLVGELGAGPDPLVHWLEPEVFLQGATQSSTGGLPARLYPPTGSVLGVVAGFRNALGRRHRHAAAAIDLNGGWITDGEDARPVTQAAVSASGRLGAVDVTGVWDTASNQSAVVLARSRVGRVDSAHLDAWVDGGGEQPMLGRWLRVRALERVLGAWLDAEGWSTGGGVGLPLPWGITGVSGVVYDLTTDRLLSVNGGLRYDHPCRCVAVSGAGGHRVGREGIDVWVTIDLVP